MTYLTTRSGETLHRHSGQYRPTFSNDLRVPLTLCGLPASPVELGQAGADRVVAAGRMTYCSRCEKKRTNTKETR